MFDLIFFLKCLSGRSFLSSLISLQIFAVWYQMLKIPVYSAGEHKLFSTEKAMYCSYGYILSTRKKIKICRNKMILKFALWKATSYNNSIYFLKKWARILKKAMRGTDSHSFFLCDKKRLQCRFINVTQSYYTIW